MSSPDSSLADYVSSLHRLIEAVRRTRAAVDELREKNRAMHARLAPIGQIIAYQPQTTATDHALAMLAWVVKTGFTTVDQVDRSFAPTGKQLAELAVTARALADIGASLRSIAAPAANSTSQDDHADR